MVVVRGIAMYVGGAVFSDEVDAAVEGTRRGPIMLMRSSGFLWFFFATGLWVLGGMARLCWFNVGNRCFSCWAYGR